MADDVYVFLHSESFSHAHFLPVLYLCIPIHKFRNTLGTLVAITNWCVFSVCHLSCRPHTSFRPSFHSECLYCYLHGHPLFPVSSSIRRIIASSSLDHPPSLSPPCGCLAHFLVLFFCPFAPLDRVDSLPPFHQSGLGTSPSAGGKPMQCGLIQRYLE